MVNEMSTQILNILKDRKATRAFSSAKLPEEMINQLMDAAQLSASCFNNQPWRFLFLTEESALEKGRMALSKGNGWAKEALLLVVGFTKPDLDCQLPDGRNYFQFDLGMAVQNILLQATELNLVARPMAGFSQDVIRQEFDIPKEFEIMVMVAIGFEGNINEMDEKLQAKSKEPRKRNPLPANFFINNYE
ncbi:nitroreductase family protein [candidate division KSB1 bacterium]|nr:nitroreductase family protein [candidate division KSB1 bacterium]